MGIVDCLTIVSTPIQTELQVAVRGGWEVHVLQEVFSSFTMHYRNSLLVVSTLLLLFHSSNHPIIQSYTTYKLSLSLDSRPYSPLVRILGIPNGENEPSSLSARRRSMVCN